MKPYEKIGWVDHVVDVATEEVIQEGTPVSQTNMNHMDDGIFQNREAVILHEGMIAANQQEIKVLKDATLNNMVNNVFLKNFDSVDAVLIISGVFDPVARKIYVQGLLHPERSKLHTRELLRRAFPDVRRMPGQTRRQARPQDYGRSHSRSGGRPRH